MAAYELRIHPSCKGCRFSSPAANTDRQGRSLYCSDRSERVADSELCLRFNPRIRIAPIPPPNTPNAKG